jgi:hypothetical protein
MTFGQLRRLAHGPTPTTEGEFASALFEAFGMDVADLPEGLRPGTKVGPRKAVTKAAARRAAVDA